MNKPTTHEQRTRCTITLNPAHHTLPKPSAKYKAIPGCNGEVVSDGSVLWCSAVDVSRWKEPCKPYPVHLLRVLERLG